MGDPVSAAVVGGTLLKAGGSVLAGNAKKKAAYAEASQVEMQARVRAKNIRKLAEQVRGTARAGYAASGVVVDEGSALIADAHITRESELDALYTLLSGKMRSQALRQGGKAAQKAGYLNAATSILSGGGQLASI